MIPMTLFSIVMGIIVLDMLEMREYIPHFLMYFFVLMGAFAMVAIYTIVAYFIFF